MTRHSPFNKRTLEVVTASQSLLLLLFKYEFWINQMKITSIHWCLLISEVFPSWFRWCWWKKICKIWSIKCCRYVQKIVGQGNLFELMAAISDLTPRWAFPVFFIIIYDIFINDDEENDWLNQSHHYHQQHKHEFQIMFITSFKIAISHIGIWK